MIFTRKFWKAAIDRSVRTFAQTFAALIPSTAVAFGDVDWVLTASASLIASAVSIATSISSTPPEVDQ